MSVKQFVEELARDGVQLWVEGDRLRYSGPKEALSATRLDRLRAEKPALLGLLAGLPAPSGRQEPPATYPLSCGQRALWYLYQTAPDSAAYNTASSVRILGPLNRVAFHAASRHLLERHPVLRSTFALRGDECVQTIGPVAPAFFREMDASAWTWEELHARTHDACRRPFDLEHGPVARVDLFRRSPEDHIYLLTIHHIACDAWSTWILLDELRSLYEAAEAGTSAVLPKPQATYADYVRWQNTMLEGPGGQEHWDYWRQRLADLPAAMNLPTDRPRPRVQTFHGSTRQFRLPDDLTDRLRSLARTEGVTLYMVLLAAFDALLFRYTGAPDLVVGGAASGRTQSEFASVVGYFVNPLVMRADLAGNPTFRQLVGQVRQTVLDGLRHQDFPFSLLVERLHPEHDPSRSPLFQVTFGWQRPQQFEEVAEMWSAGESRVQIDWAGLKLESYPVAQQEGQFDLTLDMLEAQRSLSGFLKYNTDLFDTATIQRMIGHFQTVLESVAANLDTRVADVPLLTPDERAEVVQRFNATDRPYPAGATLDRLFVAQAAKVPDAVAVTFDGSRLTYAELDRRSNQLAHRLRRLGVGPDAIVGILMERSLEMVVAILGVLKAGGGYLPLDPDYPAERLRLMLDDSQPAVFLVQPWRRSEFADRPGTVVELDPSWRQIDGEPGEAMPPLAKPESLAYIIYTSGSTGVPKGVMIPHRAISNHMLWMAETFPLNAGDAVLQKTPCSFDASVWEFYAPLVAGARLVMAKPGGHKDPAYLVRAIQEERITTLQMVPTLLQLLVDEPDYARCRSLRRVFAGGEPLTAGLADRAAAVGAEVFNLYGPTECTIDATWAQWRGGEASAAVPIGRPIANLRAYVLDGRGRPMPVGVPGELYLGGVGLALGYLRQPELTAERFVADPFSGDPSSRLYKTGDQVRWLAGGELEFLGRLDHQVKLSGCRVELGEIESVLGRHPAVRDAAVVLREDQPGQRRLVAYVAVHAGEDNGPAVGEGSPLVAELRRYAQDHLLAATVPSAFVILESLPLTPNGKIDRRALPAPPAVAAERQRAYVAPRNATEQILAEIWADVLRVERVGVFDNFFDLGGGSIKSLRIVARVTEAGLIPTSDDFTPETLFQRTTIAELAEVLCLRQPHV